MRIQPVDWQDRRLVRQFLELPRQVYRAIPQWVPPLETDARAWLDRRRNPFYRHSAAGFWLALDGARPVGRLAALDNRRYNDFNREQTAFFYLFECETQRGRRRLGARARVDQTHRPERLHGPGRAGAAGERF